MYITFELLGDFVLFLDKEPPSGGLTLKYLFHTVPDANSKKKGPDHQMLIIEAKSFKDVLGIHVPQVVAQCVAV